MNTKLRIDVHFDLICPWCLIGKRNLAAALQDFRRLRPTIPVELVWRSHELLPHTPIGGLPYQTFYERRLGSRAAVAARRAQVQEAAVPAGIQFAFHRIEALPNTRAAHRLIALAKSECGPIGTAALIERLFTGYFLDGENIGDPKVLSRVAGEFGVGQARLAAALAAPEGTDLEADLHSSDVTGVPYFVFNGRHPLSGAHPPETLLEMMQLATLSIPLAESVVF